VSPFIKFKNASKETVDASDELVDELRLALIQAGQKLSRHIRAENRATDLEEKRRHIEQFGPILVDGLCRILSAPAARKKKAEEGLMKLLGRDSRAVEKELAHAVEGKQALLAKQNAMLGLTPEGVSEAAPTDVIDVETLGNLKLTLKLKPNRKKAKKREFQKKKARPKKQKKSRGNKKAAKPRAKRSPRRGLIMSTGQDIPKISKEMCQILLRDLENAKRPILEATKCSLDNSRYDFKTGYLTPAQRKFAPNSIVSSVQKNVSGHLHARNSFTQQLDTGAVNTKRELYYISKGEIKHNPALRPLDFADQNESDSIVDFHLRDAGVLS